MKNLKNRYWNFLQWFASEDIDFVITLFGLILLFVALFAPIELLRLGEPSTLGAIGLFAIPVLIFALEIAVIFPLIFACKEVCYKNEFNRMVMDCLTQVGQLREVMLPGQVYSLSKGYSHLHDDFDRVKGVLEKSLGPEFEVRVEWHHQVRNYRVELVKLLEPRETPQSTLLFADVGTRIESEFSTSIGSSLEIL